MEIIIGLSIATWAVCGFFAYGFTYGFYQNSFPTLAEENRSLDRRFATIMSFLGPIGLLSGYFSQQTGEGLRWR